MEGLRWPAMVFGLIGGAVAFVSGIIDMIAGNFTGGVIAMLSCIVLFALSAMTPSLPGWSALLSVVAAFVFLMVNSVAVAFSGPLLLIAALLGAFASRARKRAAQSRVM